MAKELEDLKKERQAVIGRIRAAKEFGDLSENSEYQDAKDQQAFIEGRIQVLEETIKKAQVLDGNHTNNSHIGIGSKVTVEADGVEDFSIVDPRESDPGTGKISAESPLGKALVSHKKGDAVKVATPSGEMEYKILAVK